MKTMSALVKSQSKPGLWMERVSVPDMGDNDVMIKPSHVAICGTDVHIYQWDKWSQDNVPVPNVLGHEYVGEVVAIGSQVTSVTVGERVSGEGHIVCKTCRNCRAGREHLCPNTLGIGVNRDGAFAEFLVIPEHNVYQVPDNIPDQIAAILDPFGNAVHTALSFDLVGEDVLITGAGPIGLMAVAICRHVGARHIVVSDLNPSRLALAEKMGATLAVNAADANFSEIIDSLGMREGFDVGLEMSGNQMALNKMIGCMNNGAHIALLGIHPDAINLDINSVIFKGLQIKGIYGREMFETWHKGVAMLQSGLDLSPVITHQMKFSEYQSGFDLLLKGEACKVILSLDE